MRNLVKEWMMGEKGQKRKGEEKEREEIEKSSALLLKAVCFLPRLFALKLFSALPTSSDR